MATRKKIDVQTSDVPTSVHEQEPEADDGIQSLSSPPAIEESSKRREGVEPDENEIRKLAFQLYEERGRVEGMDLDDWLKAEEILRREISV